MKKGFVVLILLLVSIFVMQGLWADNSYALSLDGAESFYVNDDASDNLDLSDYTFECWFNLDNYQQYDRIFDRRTVCAMSIMAANGTGDFALRFTERGSSHNVLRTLETAAAYDMDLDTWYHVAVTFDGSTARLYINDNLADSEVSSYWGLSASTNALNIGGLYNSGYSNQIDALIDEIRVSNTARSIEDMQISVNDLDYSSDSNTVLLMDLNDQGVPPTYVSGTGLSGTKGHDGITTIDYVDVSEDLPLPVTLSGFSAAFVDGIPILYWTTESETNNAYWNVYRTISSNFGQAIKLNENNSLAGQGTTTEPTDYEFVDDNVVFAEMTYWYWLESISLSGENNIHLPTTLTIPEGGSNGDIPIAPDDIGLHQNYPNPFNPNTSISFALEEDSKVTLAVYNLNGQLVKTLIDDFREAGIIHSVQWDGNDNQDSFVSSGIYLYKLTTSKETFTRKMILMK